MAPRPVKAEVDAVVGLLESPAADVVELAKAVIKAVAEARQSREFWTVIAVTGAGHVRAAYGSHDYVSKGEAEKAIKRLPVMEGERYGVCRLYSERHVEKALEAADEPARPTTVPYKHPTPYAADDLVSRRRYQRMNGRQKREETNRRTA